MTALEPLQETVNAHSRLLVQNLVAVAAADDAFVDVYCTPTSGAAPLQRKLHRHRAATAVAARVHTGPATVTRRGPAMQARRGLGGRRAARAARPIRCASWQSWRTSLLLRFRDGWHAGGGDRLNAVAAAADTRRRPAGSRGRPDAGVCHCGGSVRHGSSDSRPGGGGRAAVAPPSGRYCLPRRLFAGPIRRGSGPDRFGPGGGDRHLTRPGDAGPELVKRSPGLFDADSGESYFLDAIERRRSLPPACRLPACAGRHCGTSGRHGGSGGRPGSGGGRCVRRRRRPDRGRQFPARLQPAPARLSPCRLRRRCLWFAAPACCSFLPRRSALLPPPPPPPATAATDGEQRLLRVSESAARADTVAAAAGFRRAHSSLIRAVRFGPGVNRLPACVTAPAPAGTAATSARAGTAAAANGSKPGVRRPLARHRQLPAVS